jgi:hypothetical protein
VEPETEGLTKIGFELNAEKIIGSVRFETLWSRFITGDQYRLRNVPCYLYRFSVGDTGLPRHLLSALHNHCIYR